MSSRASYRPAAKQAAQWTGLTAALDLAWEAAQVPLYTIYEKGDTPAIALAVLHCTAGDALIALSSYGMALLVTQTPRWPLERPLSGGASAVAAGLTYTVFSEWLNVSVRGSWEYAPAMPTVYGVGVSPLLQWLVVPLLVLFIVRQVRDREDAHAKPA